MRHCGNCGQEIPPETEHFKDDMETVYCTVCIEKTPHVVFNYYMDGEYMGGDEDEDGIQFIESYEDEFEIDPLADVPDGQISLFEEEAAE